MAERSIQVDNRIANGEAVVASGRTHRDVIAPLVAQRTGTFTEEEVEQIFDRLCSALEHKSDELGVAEDRHVAELADDVELRLSRDEKIDVLFTLYTNARRRVSTAQGEAGLKRYGLEQPGTRTAPELVSRVQNAVKLMRKDPAELDDGFGALISTTTIADKLAEVAAPLAEILKEQKVEEREAEGTLTARNRVIDQWTVLYVGVAAILEGLYRIAGRDDLADRIRPTIRRASGFEPPPPDPLLTGGDPPATDPTDPGPTDPPA